MELGPKRFLLAALLCFTAGPALFAQTPESEASRVPQTLTLQSLVSGVYSQYPPYLAALIERDVAQGKLRSARGVFDFNTFVDIFDNTTGYYEATTLEAGFEQYTGVWGSTVYGGYRYTEGFLPDYD